MYLFSIFFTSTTLKLHFTPPLVPSPFRVPLVLFFLYDATVPPPLTLS